MSHIATPNKRGLTLLEILIVVIIMVVMVLIYLPRLTRSVPRSKATSAVNNAKDIYQGLIQFALDKGTFPRVNKNANLSLAPLFDTGVMLDEKPFFLDGLTTTYPHFKEPDGNISTLEANTNVFHYFGPTATTGWDMSSSPSNVPLLATPVTSNSPVSYANMKFGIDFKNQGIILSLDGAAIVFKINPKSLAIDDHTIVIQEPKNKEGLDVPFVGVPPLSLVNEHQCP